jgi:hypothetical protein
MKKTLISFKASNIYKRSIYSHISKNISINFHNNYIEPTNKEEEIEDVKYWLNVNKPKYLCIHFTNNWNPVCIEGNKKYNSFAKNTGVFKNLKIDTEQFPRLKWYFDSKCEPGFHFYYFGALLSKLGGCNYDKAITEMKRIVKFVENDSDQNSYNTNNINYEQPYYKFEDNMDRNGVEEGLDPYQFYKPIFFSGLVTMKNMPFEEKWAHSRLKK